MSTQLSLFQKFQLALYDFKDAILPERKPSVGAVIYHVTGSSKPRILEDNMKVDVITALKAVGYEQPESALEAFETLATISWTDDPRP